MKAKIFWGFGAFLVMALLLVGSVSAAGLSIQLKRTNPGIAGEKSAEVIFDVVNTEFTHKIEGFLWCRSPDDAVITSTLGVGSGSGAQYVSEKFYMDTGPSQKAISLVLEADSAGDKRTGCIIKYAPYKEEVVEGESKTEKIAYEGTVGLTETDVSGYAVKLDSYTASVQETDPETNETTVVSLAKAKISINGIPKELEVGSNATISSLLVVLVAATADNADVKISGERTAVEGGGAVQRQYLKMNGQYVSTLTDDQYREIRLDKTVPFVEAPQNAEVACPGGQASCKASEVDITKPGFGGVPIWAYLLIAVIVILAVVYLLGKTSRKD